MIIIVEVFFAALTAMTLLYGAALGTAASINPGFLAAQILAAVLLPGFLYLLLLFNFRRHLINAHSYNTRDYFFCLLSLTGWSPSQKPWLPAPSSAWVFYPEGSELRGKLNLLLC